MNVEKKFLALGARLLNCKSVMTLGVRPNFSDYTDREADMIRKADKIYYPTAFYADLFNVMRKQTFPGFHTYKFVQDKIKQTALFRLLEIPHPYTRVFYGKQQKQKICQYFKFPFIAKQPRNSSMGKGVFFIQNMEDLSKYLLNPWPAYIQEYLPVDRDMRIIIIGREVVLSYFRIARQGEFRSNISLGGEISFDPVPEQALALALDTASRCGWNDVGMDIIEYNNGFQIIEANMKYGRKGFGKAGIDYSALLETLLMTGKI